MVGFSAQRRYVCVQIYSIVEWPADAGHGGYPNTAEEKTFWAEFGALFRKQALSKGGKGYSTIYIALQQGRPFKTGAAH